MAANPLTQVLLSAPIILFIPELKSTHLFHLVYNDNGMILDLKLTPGLERRRRWTQPELTRGQLVLTYLGQHQNVAFAGVSR
jgi:hypothetical protein